MSESRCIERSPSTRLCALSEHWRFRLFVKGAFPECLAVLHESYAQALVAQPNADDRMRMYMLISGEKLILCIKTKIACKFRNFDLGITFETKVYMGKSKIEQTNCSCFKKEGLLRDAVFLGNLNDP